MGEWRSDLENAPRDGVQFLSYWPSMKNEGVEPVTLVYYDADGFLRCQSGVLCRGEPDYWAEVDPVPKRIRFELEAEVAQGIAAALSGRHRSILEDALLEALRKGIRSMERPE